VVPVSISNAKASFAPINKVYDPNKYCAKASNDNGATPPENLVAKANGFGEERRSVFFGDEHRVLCYRNGTQKEVLPDGTKIVKFTNGDIKTTYPNAGIVVYFYATAKVRIYLPLSC